MAGLDLAIYEKRPVDARDTPGHDDEDGRFSFGGGLLRMMKSGQGSTNRGGTWTAAASHG